MTPDPIWLPFCAMALLTALVWIRLYADRLGEMRRRHIDPQRRPIISATCSKCPC